MADQQEFSTDAVLDVFDHVIRSEMGWDEFVADHGIDPNILGRALRCTFEGGEGRLDVAWKAFVLGMQFGAMRLDPVAYKREEAATGPCLCAICQIRRATEGKNPDGSEDGPEESAPEAPGESS